MAGGDCPHEGGRGRVNKTDIVYGTHPEHVLAFAQIGIDDWAGAGYIAPLIQRTGKAHHATLTGGASEDECRRARVARSAATRPALRCEVGIVQVNRLGAAVGNAATDWAAGDCSVRRIGRVDVFLNPIIDCRAQPRAIHGLHRNRKLLIGLIGMRQRNRPLTIAKVGLGKWAIANAHFDRSQVTSVDAAAQTQHTAAQLIGIADGELGCAHAHLRRTG